MNFILFLCLLLGKVKVLCFFDMWLSSGPGTVYWKDHPCLRAFQWPICFKLSDHICVVCFWTLFCSLDCLYILSPLLYHYKVLWLLISCSVNTPTLFFFIVFLILFPLCFHMNLETAYKFPNTNTF